jgi:hypothetical protein
MVENHYEQCPSCSSPVKYWRAKTVNGKTYTIDFCKGCGFAFVNPRPSFDFLMDFYSESGHSHDGDTRR